MTAGVVGRSIQTKLMVVMLATTAVALLVAAVAMVGYEIRAYRLSLIDDLTAQADILARASAPALAFDDPKAANENLSILRAMPKVTAAAIYGAKGSLFAKYTPGDAAVEFPPSPASAGHAIEGDRVELTRRVVEKGEVIGSVYIRARYELAQRLVDYLAILVVTLVASLGIAAVMSAWLQRRVTQPILAVAGVARQVMERRDFTLRVEKTTDDEVGVLVDAFNDMLSEVGRRAQALEASNRQLEHEMVERRLAEESLRIADRRKDEFLATLAHELRNPLAPVRNGLALLRLAGSDPDKTRRALDMMERQLEQLVRLVDDLLDVSRITTGKLTLRPERVELASVVASAVETVRGLVDARGHVLSVELPPVSLVLEADPTRLSQVLANLLNNAAKYTEPGGRIELRATVEGDRAVLRVRDNGVGISPRMLSAVFDMFLQVDQSLERANAGLGVGLALARHLVELHGGTLEAHSEGLGKGSEFVVSLPIAHPAGAARIPPDRAPPQR